MTPDERLMAVLTRLNANAHYFSVIKGFAGAGNIAVLLAHLTSLTH